MKKKIIIAILCLLLIAVATNACLWLKDKNAPTDQDELIPSSHSTLLKTTKTVSELGDAKSVVFAFLERCANGFDTYRYELTGTTKFKVGFINYVQNVSAIYIKNGNSYFSTDESSSALYSTYEACYENADGVAFSTDGTNFSAITLDEYHALRGYSPSDALLFGYVMTDETIKSSSLTSENGVFTLTYRLDDDLATPYMKTSMKAKANMTKYPVLSDITVTLRLKDDFTPLSATVTLDATVSMSFLGDVNTKQTFDYSFFDVNEPVTIANQSALNDLLHD